MVMNINAIRVADDDDLGSGRVSFDVWEGLNEFEKLAAKSFEECIENTLSHFPPTMMIDPNESGDDLIVEFWVSALGDGDSGPMWRFSMKETFDDVESDYSEEDQAEILKSLEAVTEYVRARIASPTAKD